MTHPIRRALRALLFVAAALSMSVVSAASIDGSWEGKLQAGGTTLRVVFNLVTQADGTLKATMDSPDQGAYGIPVDNAIFSDNKLRVDIKRINGDYEGTFDESKRSFSGFWTQFGTAGTLDLQPAVAQVRNRPQEPKPPFDYEAEDVTFENKAAGVKFAGTLTYPRKGKNFPAVVLITGSGPQDRNEEIMGHKPFLVLADDLTRRGLAVLRVDDRGVGGSTSKGPATSEDFAADALAAVDYLKSRKEIDKKHIGLVGHSEGGLIAPLAANRSKDVAFVVLLAGPGVSGRQVLEKQQQLIAEAQKINQLARAMQSRLQSRLIDFSLNSKDDADAYAQFDAWWAEQSKAAEGTGQEAAVKSVGEGYRAQLKSLLNPWMKFFLTYDPTAALTKLKVPVIAVNGSLDLQVAPSQNLPPMEAAFKQGGNKDFTIKELPGLNHLFQKAKTGSPSEYAEIEETFNPVALETVGGWIVARTLKPSKK